MLKSIFYDKSYYINYNLITQLINEIYHGVVWVKFSRPEVLQREASSVLTVESIEEAQSTARNICCIYQNS